MPKLTDFGFSTSGAKENITLPVSHGWTAPEVVIGSQKLWSFAQAKQADVFSLGLVCLWLLDDLHLSLIQASESPADVFGQAHDSAWSRKVDVLSQSDGFTAYCRELLDRAEGLSMAQIKMLDRFFQLSLCCSPSDRVSDVDQLLEALGLEE